MNLRSLFVLLIMLAIGALAALNWATLSVPTTVSLGLTTVEAPLGLVMLSLTALLAVFFLAYVLTLQGSVLMETRRHTKELAAQRELADKAEASRFTELRGFLESQHAGTLARLDALEARLQARTQEAENVTAAYVGQLEDQIHHRVTPAPGARPTGIEPSLRL